MWKNIQIEAKERFGVEGWQKKIKGNFPRHWSTCAQDYGEFTTPTVRWRLDPDATPQKPTSGTVPWETTNSFYGGALDLYEKKTFHQHVTSTVSMPVNGKHNRFQRSRYNPHPGIRLEKIPGMKAKDDFLPQESSTKGPPSIASSWPGPSHTTGPSHTKKKPKQGPSIYEKFQSSRYVTPWKVSYKA